MKSIKEKQNIVLHNLAFMFFMQCSGEDAPCPFCWPRQYWMVTDKDCPFKKRGIKHCDEMSMDMWEEWLQKEHIFDGYEIKDSDDETGSKTM